MRDWCHLVNFLPRGKGLGGSERGQALHAYIGGQSVHMPGGCEGFLQDHLHGSEEECSLLCVLGLLCEHSLERSVLLRTIYLKVACLGTE